MDNQTSSKSKSKKKGGPYSKSDRQARRSEVYRLHFEYGYSATKISELMKINRNTINVDIQYLYSTIQNDEDKVGLGDLINKQLIRFEFQRTRLMEALEKATSFQQKQQLERLIFDIDSKLINLSIKIYDSKLNNWDSAVNFINKWMKDNHKDTRYLLNGDLVTISENKRDRINKILKAKE